MTTTLTKPLMIALGMPMTSMKATWHMLLSTALGLLTTMANSQLKAVLKTYLSILQTQLTAVLKGAALVVTPVLNAVVAHSPSTLGRLLTATLVASIVKPSRLLKSAATGWKMPNGMVRQSISHRPAV